MGIFCRFPLQPLMPHFHDLLARVGAPVNGGPIPLAMPVGLFWPKRASPGIVAAADSALHDAARVTWFFPVDILGIHDEPNGPSTDPSQARMADTSPPCIPPKAGVTHVPQFRSIRVSAATSVAGRTTRTAGTAGTAESIPPVAGPLPPSPAPASCPPFGLVPAPPTVVQPRAPVVPAALQFVPGRTTSSRAGHTASLASHPTCTRAAARRRCPPGRPPNCN